MQLHKHSHTKFRRAEAHEPALHPSLAGAGGQPLARVGGAGHSTTGPHGPRDYDLRSITLHPAPPIQRRPHLVKQCASESLILRKFSFWLMAVRERLDRFCSPVSKFWVSFWLSSLLTVLSVFNTLYDFYAVCTHACSGVTDRLRVVFTPLHQI